MGDVVDMPPAPADPRVGLVTHILTMLRAWEMGRVSSPGLSARWRISVDAGNALRAFSWCRAVPSEVPDHFAEDTGPVVRMGMQGPVMFGLPVVIDVSIPSGGVTLEVGSAIDFEDPR